MDEETPLPQGGTVKGVVRVANTVRRRPSPRAEYVRAVLRLLEERGIAAPRFLGRDDEGRDIFNFIAGDAAHGRTEWSDTQLQQIAQLVRAMHDATAGNSLADGSEVVCHNDLAPWNLIVEGERPVAFIDFDEAAPGRRIDDVGYLIWTFLGLGNASPPEAHTQRIALICAAYGVAPGGGLIDAIVGQQMRIASFRRARAADESFDADTRRFNASRAELIQTEIVWVQRHRDTLVSAL